MIDIGLPSVVGYGELIYDHVFEYIDDNHVVYRGSRGGGSVWNTLCQLAVLGIPTSAVACQGDDVYGHLARMELHQLGVNTSNVKVAESRATRVIYERLNRSNATSCESTHSLSTRCLVCGKRPLDSCFPRVADYFNELSLDWNGVRILCVDRLTADSVKLAAQAREHGVYTVLDVGRIGHLRYVPVAQILSYVSVFDMVLMPAQVAESLSRRANLQDVSDILKIGKTRLLFISRDKDGMTSHFRLGNGSTEFIVFPAVAGMTAVDTCGAGDSFLANLIYQLLTSQGFYACARTGACPRKLVGNATELALSAIEPVLLAYGARGHLPSPRPGRAATFLTRNRGSKFAVHHGVTEAENCPFCAVASEARCNTTTEGKRVYRRTGIRRNVAELLRRALFAAERKEAVAQCKNLLSGISTAYVVGTGGSFPAATYIAQLISAQPGKIAQAIRPFDYYRMPGYCDCLIVVSHSGRTSDCGLAIERAVGLGVRHIAIVTAAREPRLADVSMTAHHASVSVEVISYSQPNGRPGLERGFVSVAGTVSPCAVFAASVAELRDFSTIAADLEEKRNGNTESIRSIISALREGRVIHVFGGGFAWPAMLDIESKFTEGGLGTVQLHESKDFSHGRFMLVLAQRHPTSGCPDTSTDEIHNDGDCQAPMVIVQVGTALEYERQLKKVLERQAPLVTISSSSEGAIGSLEALIHIQYLVEKIASGLRLDISRPSCIPRQGLSLYHWKPRK